MQMQVLIVAMLQMLQGWQAALLPGQIYSVANEDAKSMLFEK